MKNLVSAPLGILLVLNLQQQNHQINKLNYTVINTET